MYLYTSGYRLLILVAVLTAIAVGSALYLSPTYSEALLHVMWPTAQGAFLLFFMAFTASSFQILRPSIYSRWAIKNRRYIGLSFAFVHFVHAVLVLSGLWLTSESRETQTLAIGGLAYVFLLLMVLTSNNASIRMLGAKLWKLLHKAGSYYIWFIFLATSSIQPDSYTNFDRSWLPLLCVIAFLIRIAAFRKMELRNRIKTPPPL